MHGSLGVLGLSIGLSGLKYYKQYLLATEYLQLDPTKEYEVGYIEKRVDDALSSWHEDDKDYIIFSKNVKWFKKNYKRFINKNFNYPIVTQRYIEKKRIEIDLSNVNDTYIKQPLTNFNMKSYHKFSFRVICFSILTLVLFIGLIVWLIILLN